MRTLILSLCAGVLILGADAAAPQAASGQDCYRCHCPGDPDGPGTCELIGMESVEWGKTECMNSSFGCCYMSGSSCQWEPEFATAANRTLTGVPVMAFNEGLSGTVFDADEGVFIRGPDALWRDCRGLVRQRTYAADDRQRLTKAVQHIVL